MNADLSAIRAAAALLKLGDKRGRLVPKQTVAHEQPPETDDRDR